VHRRSLAWPRARPCTADHTPRPQYPMTVPRSPARDLDRHLHCSTQGVTWGGSVPDMMWCTSSMHTRTRSGTRSGALRHTRVMTCPCMRLHACMRASHLDPVDLLDRSRRAGAGPSYDGAWTVDGDWRDQSSHGVRGSLSRRRLHRRVPTPHCRVDCRLRTWPLRQSLHCPDL